MKLKSVFSALLLGLVCSLSAMENEDRQGLIKDITSNFGLENHEHLAHLAFLDSRRVSYLAHAHPGGNHVSRFGMLDTESSSLPFIIQEINHPITACNITQKGNLLFGCLQGQVGICMETDGAVKLFPPRSSSPIISLAHNVVLNGHDKKLCKVIAALAQDGNLHCFADDARNACSKLLLSSLRETEQRIDQEIVAADMKTYSTSCGMLPFVAFALRYRVAHAGPGQYAHKVLVYNPINDAIVAFKGHTGHITDVSFLPDTTVCSASADGTIRLWDPIKKEKLYTVQCVTQQVDPCWGYVMNHNMGEGFGHNSVRNVTPSPCGRYIASIDIAGRLRLWDVDSGACLHTTDLNMCPCSAMVTNVAFSPDSSRLCVYNEYFQRIYDVRHCVERRHAFSAEERANALQTFKRKQGASAQTSLFEVLRNRELGKK